MKKDAVLEKLKEAIKSRFIPQHTRFPKPVAPFTKTDIESDEERDSKQLPAEHHEYLVIDTVLFDYTFPTIANSYIV
jgi:hypothetical protein